MKVIVAHPAQQHSFRLATALKMAGVLDSYVTTVYYKDRTWTKLISTVLKGKFKKKAQLRNCSELDDLEVTQFCEIEGLFKLLALNISVFKKYYYQLKYHTADRFAKKVAKYAIKKKVDMVITYDDTSPLLFEILEKKAPHIIRVMDMSSANLLYLKKIYEKDMIIAPDFSERMKNERSICWNTKIIERVKREINSTQKFLVPSNFVAKSLEYSGVSIDQMYVCPYGVDVEKFSIKQFKDMSTRSNYPIRFIYVGGVKELKGIYYLLEAFKDIPKECAELTIVGNYNENDLDIQPYKDRVRFTGNILHSQVAEELKNADVFVFASLGEGLSLSTLEAAACGLPLIVTENSGVNDGITQGVQGFVIPVQSIDAIKEKVEWFINNPEMIEHMGRAARDFALNYTWENYYKNIAKCFQKMVQ